MQVIDFDLFWFHPTKNQKEIKDPGRSHGHSISGVAMLEILRDILMSTHLLQDSFSYYIRCNFGKNRRIYVEIGPGLSLSRSLEGFNKNGIEVSLLMNLKIGINLKEEERDALV